MEDGLKQSGAWYQWGPYVSERQWGTVREDYSEDGDAWNYLPHDHARSRAYRWGEDGLAGFCDIEQRLCLGLALWNGRDPFLKERIFGLTGPQGNHGEDAKEHWWYLDAVPSHAWNRWRYHYPQAAFPYDKLVTVNGTRDRRDPEYEILDTGIFDLDRYWITEVTYAKASPTDLLVTIRVTNAGPDADTIHVLPTAWFRNTWSWDADEPKPVMARIDVTASAVGIEHPFLGGLELLAAPAVSASGSNEAEPAVLFCENETNYVRLYECAAQTPYPKDGINDHVVSGAATVNPENVGTKCAFWYKLTIEPHSTAEVRLRLRPAGGASPATAEASGGAGVAGGMAAGGPFGAQEFDAVLRKRREEADEFYAELTPAAASADEAMVLRQAFAGLLWSKQLYSYDVARWLDGDSAQPAPPPERAQQRNARWRNFNAFDIMSMPDKWEYPWFAAWDMAFHCVALAHVDPAFAKYQLVLLCREWFQHPNGALPAYEWDFSDVNPPVQAWAALEVFALDGGTDLDFLARIFDKLLVNFTWWVNREDHWGNNLFEGGFLGLDNIGPIDRSHLPPDTVLEQSDATGWMAFYALSMATIATILMRAGSRRAGGDLVLKFIEHYAAIAQAMKDQGMWDAGDGIFYDKLNLPNGTQMPVKAKSMAGMIPMLAVGTVERQVFESARRFGKKFAAMLDEQEVAGAARLRERGIYTGSGGKDAVGGPGGDGGQGGEGGGGVGGQSVVGGQVGGVGGEWLALSLLDPGQLEATLGHLFDEGQFLSRYGLRSLSAAHKDNPYLMHFAGINATIDYEPAESTSAMFGGNSNWRGPIWLPLNYLFISSLETYHQFLGPEFVAEYPTGSGEKLPLDAIAADLRARLVSIFTRGADGRRPCFGWVERLQHDPEWRDNVVFNEYFHGDNAAGLGASHQTGWTGLIADVIRRRHGGVPSVARYMDDLFKREGN
jgi:hypothetical protein